MVDDDGRTPDHGHPISSPCEPNGSGELKMLATTGHNCSVETSECCGKASCFVISGYGFNPGLLHTVR